LKATWQSLTRLPLLLVALAGGCDAAQPYRTVLRDQNDALGELEKILSTVTDQASMKAVRVQLSERFEIFESIRQRAQKLSPPSQDVMQSLQEAGEQLKVSLQKVQEQVRRINGLPGGPEFFASLEPIKGFFGEPVR
jgi:hypothetical protein